VGRPKIYINYKMSNIEEEKKSQATEIKIDDDSDVTKRKPKKVAVKKIKPNGGDSSDEEFKPSEVKFKPNLRKVHKVDADDTPTCMRNTIRKTNRLVGANAKKNEPML
jgi:hypothetical protein